MSRNPLKLDEEELQILGDFERREFVSIQNFRAEKRRKAAKAGRRGRSSVPDVDCQHPA